MQGLVCRQDRTRGWSWILRQPGNQKAIDANAPTARGVTMGASESAERLPDTAKTVRLVDRSTANPISAPAAAPIGTVLIDHWTRQPLHIPPPSFVPYAAAATAVMARPVR